MSQTLPAPWNPERRSSNLLIATLALMIGILLGSQSRLHALHPVPLESQVSLDGRLEDLALAGPRLLPSLGSKALSGPALSVTAAATRPGWNQALLAVHAAENGDRTLGLTLARTAPGPTGEAFLRLWRWGYLGEGAPPDATARLKVQQALGNGYAARILEARVQARAGGDVLALERAARQWALPRLLALGAVYGAGFLLALAGVGFGLFLLFARTRSGAGSFRPLPSYRLPGRAVLLVLLGWFLTLLVAGPVVSLFLAIFPFLRPVTLPLVYAFHAVLGTTYLCCAEGVDLRTLWRRAVPESPARVVGWGLGFFSLAFAAVMAVSLLLSPFFRNHEPAQKELLQLMANLKGPLALALVFFTVAVLAPVFEELLFRGFLLPWLGERLERRLGSRMGWSLALLLTALAFGIIHMQPLGLPTLSTLGLVLGLAYLRTGNLGTSILVHGLWNGGVFIAMRFLGA